MPACLVQQQHRMRTGRDRLADLLQLRDHGLCVTIGQDETGALALRRADRAEDVGPQCTLVVWGARPCSPPGPAPGDLVLLSDTGFIMPPKFYLGAGRQTRPDRHQLGRQAFLNCSISSSFWA
jgi:hypothetical protein